MVKRENLLVIAGLFWIFAGVNVAGIGVRSFFETGSSAWPWMLVVMAVVFIGFGLMFRKVSRKHAARIMAHPCDRVSFIHTFDAKGYLIIAVMMGGGIALRAFNLVPQEFIGSFYPGLGAALALTGATLIAARWGKGPALAR
ncbi:hypothetical protein VJ923_01580 [Adlercreutzia sp. R25]|uniref:Uncharacterized protein n=1 Tax=Adlercreutzia shanghongiae TaxID=3111773 RepID=A0ABU6IYV6_9ACTN|nr:MULTISPECIES: hypothetical protein [unclassified Adlercreutzia]MEC4271849.1 hypothetical protein [Adlercreutzia sp. R25]MEC4294856.1 hypothetical protein [Adlercreutzia sp. R22]